MRMIVDDFRMKQDVRCYDSEVTITGRMSSIDASTCYSHAVRTHTLEVNASIPSIKLDWNPKLETNIRKVVFNDPATIVYWDDNTKTVVKCQKGDVFDKEKGLALCYMKKALGNKSSAFNKILKEYQDV